MLPKGDIQGLPGGRLLATSTVKGLSIHHLYFQNIQWFILAMPLNILILYVILPNLPSCINIYYQDT